MAATRLTPLTLCCALLLCGAAAAQAPQESCGEYRISTTVEMVMLNVSVTDKSGGFVSGLAENNFLVYEDGRQQEIQTFHQEDAPVSVGLVIDTSGSMRPKMPYAVAAAATFLSLSNPEDQVFVVNFNEAVEFGLPEGVPYTSDRTLLEGALKKGSPQGQTALYDALYAALMHLRQAPLKKRVILLISDGGDNRSRRTLEEVLVEAKASNVLIYSIGLYDEDAKDKDPGVLKRLAQLSGGQSFLPYDPVRALQACRQIAADIRAQYSIGYAAPDGEEAYRTVKVLVKSPDRRRMQVRTREGYLHTPSKTGADCAPANTVSDSGK
jgi:Ca-activated chloride channel homolog